MRQRLATGDQTIAILPADKTIQEPVPVNVARLRAPAEETDTAQAMDAGAHAGPAVDCRFNRADGAEPFRGKQPGGAEQQRVEELGRAGNSREPFQSSDCERKY